MAVTDNIIDLSGLEDLRNRASYIGKYAWADAVQTAVNELADAGLLHLADDWSKAIKGGPVPYADVSTRSSSAVTTIKRKGATKGIAEAKVRVKDRQSAFLKFALGEAQDRDAGDVGAASRYNFIPVEETLRTRTGINLTPQGNLPRNALSKLVRRTEVSRSGANPQSRDRRGRFQPTERGDAGSVGTFFGTLRQRGKRPVTAFWSRGGARKGKLRALAFAVEKSRYKPSLVPTWNAAMEATEANVPSILRPILERLLDAKFGRQQEGRRKKSRDARNKRSSGVAEKAIKRARQAAEALADGRTPEVIAAERKAAKKAYDRARNEARRAAQAHR